MTLYSSTVRVSGWGSRYDARRVTHLTADERAHVREGLTVFVRGPDGEWSRRVVARGRAIYTRTLESDTASRD